MAIVHSGLFMWFRRLAKPLEKSNRMLKKFKITVMFCSEKCVQFKLIGHDDVCQVSPDLSFI